MLTTKLTAIADAIRSKTGETATMTLADMPNKISGISGSEDIEWHQCPELVRNYLANVTYDASDYTTSQIANYAPSTAVESNYRPIGATVGAETYYNEVPNTQTPFANSEKAGTLKPLDRLRYIKTTAHNVRDLGGWACDGGTVKYGLLFRGGYLSASDRAAIVDELGVKHDLDLRGASEAGNITVSPLGSDVYYTCAESYAWYTLTADCWKTNLRTVFDAVTHGEPVYFHCSAGADRTGTLACVLEGLLGVSQSDIDKDYELTSFYSGTDTDNHARRRNESEWSGLITQINAKNGDTFRNKCITFVAELGFTADEINAFRAAMVDGTPETVTPSIATYTVTNTLTNVMSDNGTTSATQYQPYTANIEAASGYVIDSIKVTMGGADITASVWDGCESNLFRAVNATLINCSISNSSKKVIDGQSYAATITAADGYTLEGATVSMTMGGVDVLAYYKDGTIAIPSVTGNITITVTAVESATVNLFDKATSTINMRYSGGANEVAANGYYISNYLPVTAGQTVTLTGVVNSTADKICFYDANKSALGFAYIYTSKVSSGSNAATLFSGDATNGYTNTIGYTWTGTADAAAASYYAQIAYVRINQKVSTSALTSTDEIPDHTFS